jgi:hypothetical protein
MVSQVEISLYNVRNSLPVILSGRLLKANWSAQNAEGI